MAAGSLLVSFPDPLQLGLRMRLFLYKTIARANFVITYLIFENTVSTFLSFYKLFIHQLFRRVHTSP